MGILIPFHWQFLITSWLELESGARARRLFHHEFKGSISFLLHGQEDERREEF